MSKYILTIDITAQTVNIYRTGVIIIDRTGFGVTGEEYAPLSNVHGQCPVCQTWLHTGQSHISIYMVVLHVQMQKSPSRRCSWMVILQHALSLLFLNLGRYRLRNPQTSPSERLNFSRLARYKARRLSLIPSLTCHRTPPTPEPTSTHIHKTSILNVEQKSGRQWDDERHLSCHPRP